MNLLIPYISIFNHEDPTLDEFTYGDINTRARKCKLLPKGSHLFFHTSINNTRHITAYYVVDRILDTSKAIKDKHIKAKYKNPHLREYEKFCSQREDDVIIFGDPILSRKLEKPLLFDETLAQKLSISIPFKKGRTDNQCISSATRQWRKLTEKDVSILLDSIKENETVTSTFDKLLSTDEVTELIEKDLENFIEANQKLLGENLTFIRRQYDTPVGRIDMIFEDRQGKKIIIELKLNKIGRDAVNQLRRYMDHLKKETKRDVKGILVCKGIMPAFEEELSNLKNIKIVKYGWKLQTTPL